MYHRQLITPLLVLPSNQFFSLIRGVNLHIFLSHSIVFILNLSICKMKRKYGIYDPARTNWSSLRIVINNTSHNITYYHAFELNHRYEPVYRIEYPL